MIFDGRDRVPRLLLAGSDGELAVAGLAAIEQLSNALLQAERMARRMAG